MKFKKNDEILVTGGKDAGKKGKIEKIFPKTGKILVAGVNIYKRHMKPRGQGKPGGIIDLAKPLPQGNIALMCPKCNKPTRVGFNLEGGVKSRICRKCGQTI